MKGIIFNLLEEAVTKSYGEETWDELIDKSGVDGAYTAVGTYPDEDLMSMVAAASEKLDTSHDEVVRWLGRESIPMLVSRYPTFFHPHSSTRSFVLTLNEVIHPEVRKLFPGAYAPEFEFDDSDSETLKLSYMSHRKLCSFAEGLLEGAASHYGETVQIEQPECSKRGAERCVLVCRFEKAA